MKEKQIDFSEIKCKGLVDFDRRGFEDASNAIKSENKEFAKRLLEISKKCKK